MERLTLDELRTVTGGTLSRPAARRTSFTGVSFDTRTLQPGDAFWALSGTRHDGHDFIAEAFNRGAAAAVSTRAVEDAAGPVLVVDDCVAALGRFASWYRSLHDALVIGVTGSVGKTTTREMIFAALGGEPHVLRSRKNFNNHLGVPATLLDLERRHTSAVVEMGADRPGEIAALAKMARPEAGVITALGVAHVETFGSEDAIVAAKAELLNELPSGGFAILPGDQEKARSLASCCRARCLFVGTGRDNAHHVVVREAAPNRIRFSVDGSRFEVAANGQHFAVPAAMAVTVARQLGRSDRQIARDLLSFQPVPGRGRVAVSEPWTIIDDTYNANPDSMQAGLDALAAWPTRGRRILVCGDMYGLGSRASAAHVELGQAAATRGIDLVAAIGHFARQVAHGARRSGMDARCLALFDDRQAAVEWLLTALRPGDVVWVKASRPLELERLVEELAAGSLATSRRLRTAA